MHLLYPTSQPSAKQTPGLLLDCPAERLRTSGLGQPLCAMGFHWALAKMAWKEIGT